MVVVGKYNRRFELLNFFRSHESIRHDDHCITYMNKVGSSTIDTDASTTALTWNNVSLDTSTIGIIYHLNFLASIDIGGLHKVLINSYTTDIIQIGLCDCNAMYFGFQYL